MLAAPVICNCLPLEKQPNHAETQGHDCHHEKSDDGGNQSHHDHQACFCANVPAIGVNEVVPLNTSPLSFIAVLNLDLDQYELSPVVIDRSPYYHSPPQRLALYLKKSSFLI
ncbi:MAG: hypothetical protein F9K48_01030 [Candidatus Brocadia sp.]|nr:MAG: hypothetical protein F9K48_01030 [Candidatus Brocadia sp.]